MRISDNVMLVGSGQYGMQLSHPLDCNVYLLDGGNAEYALIDAGSGLEPERIVANITNAGVSMSCVKYLLLTHAHGDHAAGAHFFSENYHLKVIAAVEAVPWIEQGDLEKTSLKAAKEAGVYPDDFQFYPCSVARGVSENDVVWVGELGLKVIKTPGHSKGHVSFLMEKAGEKSLFAGDTLFAGGKIVLQNIWDCSIQEYAETIAKIHLLKLDCLYPGHGVFLLSEAWRHAERAHGFFTKLELPPNL